MFAVIKTGGKQYNVVSNDLIRVEKLPGKVGDTIELKEVLLVGEDTNIAIGMPIVEGAFIIAKIVEQERASKVMFFRFRISWDMLLKLSSESENDEVQFIS